MLTSLYGYLSLFKYGAVLGLILFATDFIWTWQSYRIAEKNSVVLNFEINNLKAKVYDLQEASKPKSEPETESDAQ